jgi:hypothetical protein
MIEVKLPNYNAKIMFYEDIKELPIERFNLFEKLILIDSSMGSDMSYINDQFTIFSKYAISEDIGNMMKIFNNLRQRFYFTLSNIDIKTLCLSALVKNEKIKTTEDCIKYSEWLQKSGLNLGEIESLLATVKKKYSLK